MPEREPAKSRSAEENTDGSSEAEIEAQTEVEAESEAEVEAESEADAVAPVDTEDTDEARGAAEAAETAQTAEAGDPVEAGEPPAVPEGEGGEPASDSDPEAENGASPEASLEEQLQSAEDRYLRMAAEFENFKRRSLKERHDLYLYANENLIKELLPTVDNLERALEHARQTEEGGDVKKLLEGIELTHRSLLHVLENCGVQAVAGEHTAFDPEIHQAVRQVPTDRCEPGTVVEIFQKGYRLGDRLLRPSLVVVSSSPVDDPE